MVVEECKESSRMQVISANKLKEVLTHENAGETLILDVRSPAEYRHERIIGVTNVPLDEIERHTEELRKYKHIYVHCQSGSRSSQACGRLHSLGLGNIVNVEGGIQAWKNAGFPVVQSRRGLPLMRQVQIAAGSLVALGVLLGQTVNPSFAYLSGFVGVGLVFAGVSGTCLLGEMLARMPWNR
jgi:rhodanese-related sulfurtransferase